MPTLSFRAAARPSTQRRAVARSRAVGCESLFLSIDNPHELAQRPRVTQHGPMPHFRPIHKLRTLDGSAGFPAVPVAGECGGGGTVTVSLKAVTPIDTALLDAAPGVVRRAAAAAAAAAVCQVILVANTVSTATVVAPVTPIGALSRGYRGTRGERRVGEQEPAEGLGGNDRVPARQADDYWTPDVVRPHDVLRGQGIGRAFATESARPREKEEGRTRWHGVGVTLEARKTGDTASNEPEPAGINYLWSGQKCERFYKTGLLANGASLASS